MDQPAPTDPLIVEVKRLLADARFDEAFAKLKAELKPIREHYEGWLMLSAQHCDHGDFTEALRVEQAAERLDPLTGHFQTIQRQIQSRDLEGARQTANAMLTLIPNHPRAVFTLAHLAQSQGDFEQTVEILNRALESGPPMVPLQAVLISALEQCGRYADAISAARHKAKFEPPAKGLWDILTLLMRYGQNTEALAICDQLGPHIQNNPGQRSATALVRAQLLRITGEREASVEAFRECLALNPRNATAWWGLADMKTYSFTDADRSAITALKDAQGLNPLERSLAAFALAKAEEGRAGTQAAMAHYHAANALHPASGFDASVFETGVARIISSITTDTLQPQATLPKGMPIPIFIVGLPRSGSTLVEQILASHSQIEGTIEQPTLPAVKRAAHLTCVTHYGGGYLDKLGELPLWRLSTLGQSYLKSADLFRRDKTPFFTDKLPHNFEHVALIHKILPHAIIIDARRNPMDCGYSLYKQHFTQGTEFSYRLDAIGRYYNGYLKIMDHWYAIAPGRVFHLQYEELVANPEPVIRALLDHVGVGFEDACLNFHETKRAVRTASSEQVRQPMNAKGVGAWKAVEAELEPLSRALGDATLKRFGL